MQCYFSLRLVFPLYFYRHDRQQLAAPFRPTPALEPSLDLSAMCDISGQLTWRRPWTHNSEPSPAQAEEYARIVPFSHQVLVCSYVFKSLITIKTFNFVCLVQFVRPGTTNAPEKPVFATFITDADGKFRTRLPRGHSFAVITREKGTRSMHSNFMASSPFLFYIQLMRCGVVLGVPGFDYVSFSRNRRKPRARVSTW
jgi:hypothetical protein